MTSENWNKVKNVFVEAMELDPSERPSFLDRACGEDATVRSEVESLLRSHDSAGDFIERPAGVAGAAELEIPGSVGPYELLEPVAEGGMGVVYRARRADDQYQKEVAVKLVRAGFQTASLVRRFREERQILANLEHPNIARLLDGGMTNGRPYLVMEFITGSPITQYSDSRNLPLRERLKLFIEVCRAIHYAHQRLIVHRDIKPANVLVTPEGVPKLLDFGIAKIVDPAASGQGQETVARMMTPEYASPEQIRSEPVTTASDVYSLGVLLYELLTGRKPYPVEHAAPHEAARVILEKEPAPTGLPEELDTVLRKALAKEPGRRYTSAEQFSEDLIRYLEFRPVIARRDTVAYRLGKFVRRNRVPVAAATVGAIALLAASAIATLEAFEARRQRADAERRFQDVRRLANSLIYDIHDQVANLAGSLKARETLLKHSLAYLDSLSRQRGNDAALDLELARAYLRVGELQGRGGAANLGDVPGALKSFEGARSILERLTKENSANTEANLQLSLCYEQLADVTSDTAKALDHSRKSMEIADTLYRRDPQNVPALGRLAAAHLQLGVHHAQAGQFEAALASYRNALPLFEQGTIPANVALTRKRMGAVLARLGHYDESLSNYLKAVEIDEQRVAKEPADGRARMDLSYGYGDIGFVHWRQKKLDQALQWYRKSESIRADLLKADPRDVRARFGLADTCSRVCSILWEQGKRRESLATCERSAALRAEAPGVENNISAQRALALQYAGLASAWAEHKGCAAAQPWIDKTRATSDKLSASGNLDGESAKSIRERLKVCRVQYP